MNLYMYLMYALAGVTAVTLLIALGLLWNGSNKKKKLHKEIAQGEGKVHPGKTGDWIC